MALAILGVMVGAVFLEVAVFPRRQDGGGDGGTLDVEQVLELRLETGLAIGSQINGLFGGRAGECT
jgi:hypothetical protein